MKFKSSSYKKAHTFDTTCDTKWKSSTFVIKYDFFVAFTRVLNSVK